MGWRPTVRGVVMTLTIPLTVVVKVSHQSVVLQLLLGVKPLGLKTRKTKNRTSKFIVKKKKR